MHRRLEATGARKVSFGRFSQILFAESKIEMLAAEPQPRIGHRRALVDGREATTLTSSQILTGKFANRSLNPPVRDLYDFAVAGASAPRSLMIAVNALAGNEIRWRLVSWEMEREKFAEEGPLELHGVPLQYEAVRADPTHYASQAVMAAVCPARRREAWIDDAVEARRHVLRRAVPQRNPHDLRSELELPP